MKQLEMQSNNGIRIYTDGGCHNNGELKGLGSWAYTEFDPNSKIATIYCGLEYETTNNRTEMMAIINAIKSKPRHTSIDIISDSGYVVTGYTNPAYLDRWIKNYWRTSSNSPVQNQDLWEEIIRLTYHYPVSFTLVKGHNKDKDPIHALWNSIVDKACTWVMHNRNNLSIDDVIILEYNMIDKSLSFVDKIDEEVLYG